MHTRKNALECVTCRSASASTSEGSQNLSWWRWWNQYRPWERSNLEPLDGKMMSGKYQLWENIWWNQYNWCILFCV
jgi:hypothetical protein